MVKMTQSFEVFCFKYHRDIFSQLMFGHTELLTDDIQNEYIKWCQTDEGKQYLKGGSKYDENHEGNKALDGLIEWSEQIV